MEVHRLTAPHTERNEPRQPCSLSFRLSYEILLRPLPAENAVSDYPTFTQEDEALFIPHWFARMCIWFFQLAPWKRFIKIQSPLKAECSGTNQQ